jgi:hypothetical protein
MKNYAGSLSTGVAGLAWFRQRVLRARVLDNRSDAFSLQSPHTFTTGHHVNHPGSGGGWLPRNPPSRRLIKSRCQHWRRLMQLMIQYFLGLSPFYLLTGAGLMFPARQPVRP